MYSEVENLTVWEKSFDHAKQFLPEVEEKVRIGNATRLETLQARVEAALRNGDMIVAENDVMKSRVSLVNYI